MVYGYCRVSRKYQNIERQVRNIKERYPDALIIKEVFTRMTLNRKEWNKLSNRVKSGDTIVFDSVSRMSGNAEEGFSAYEELYQRGVNLEFIKEPHINTETYKRAIENNIAMVGTTVDYILEGINKFLLELAKEQIRLAFEQSQKEVEDLHQRTKEGIETARLNGKQIGRAEGTRLETQKSKDSKIAIRKYSREYDGMLNDVELIKLLRISRNTYYKYKKEMQDEENI